MGEAVGSGRALVVLAPTRSGQRKGGVEHGPCKLLTFCDETVPVDGAGKCHYLCSPEAPLVIGAGAYRDGAHLAAAEEGERTDGLHRVAAVGRFNERLHDAICEGAARHLAGGWGSLPRILTLGGDHSLAMGSVSAVSNLVARAAACGGAAFSDPRLVVVWVDAHADVNTPRTTPSGSLHGCPLSLLLGVDMPAWEGLGAPFEWARRRLCDPLASTRSSPLLCGDGALKEGAMERGTMEDGAGGKRARSARPSFVEAERLVYIGLRDVDAGEAETIESLRICAYPMAAVAPAAGGRRCVRAIVAEALARVDPAGRCPIHLSFDIDALDPLYAPSTGTPVAGGLTPEEGVAIVDELSATGRLVAMDVVEVNPALGSGGDVQKTLSCAAMLIAAFTR